MTYQNMWPLKSLTNEQKAHNLNVDLAVEEFYSGIADLLIRIKSKFGVDLWEDEGIWTAARFYESEPDFDRFTSEDQKRFDDFKNGIGRLIWNDLNRDLFVSKVDFSSTLVESIQAEWIEDK